MLNRSLLLALAVSVTILVPTYAYIASQLSDNPTGGAGGSRASSDVTYDTIASLKGNSSIVVVGEVVRVNSKYEQTATVPLPFRRFRTVFEFRADQYVKGAGPSTIYIADGVQDENGVADFSIESRAINVGSRYVLFLSSNWHWACTYGPCNVPATPLDQTFWVLGNARGKFLVSNSLVFSYNVVFPGEYTDIKVTINGVLFDDFLSMVETA